MKNYLVRIIVFFLFVFMLFGCERTSYDGYLYIVSRNSKSKEGDLVLKFNTTNNHISHIGIAFSNTKNSLVYNVSYNSMNSFGSSLIKEKINSFWSSPNKKDNRIWSLPVSREEYEKVKNHIKVLEKEKIHFDFNPNTSKGMYCSEFVYNALISANTKRFAINPNYRKLRGYERLIIGNDNLSYYPADFFIKYKRINEL